MGRKSRKIKNKKVVDITNREASNRVPLSSSSAAPLLVLTHIENSRNQTFYSLSEPNKYHHKDIPELFNKLIMGSFYGWSILKSDGSNQYSLWNPVSLETIKLPLLKSEGSFHTAVLTLSPTDPESKLILFDSDRRRMVSCGPQDHRWRTHEFMIQPEAVDSFGYMSICNGVLYAATNLFKKMFIIEASERRGFCLRDLELDLPDYRRIAHLGRYMVESCHQLLVVTIYYRGQNSGEIEAVDVSKLDFSVMEWVKMESLEGRALFLSRRYSTSCSVTDDQEGIEAGCIYFFHGEDDESNVFCYNLEKQCMSISAHCYDATKQNYAPFWMMPQDFMLANGVEQEEQDDLNKDYAEEHVVVEHIAEVEETENIFIDLPLEVLTLVWERLFLFDYLCFSRVCKKLLSFTPTQHWTINGIGLQSSQIFYPCFMFFTHGTINLIDMKRTETYFMKDPIPDLLLDSSILFSKDGWLLMCKDQHRVFCFNPFTKVIHHLPEKNEYGFLQSMGFSHSPTSSKCSYVGIADCMQGGFSIFYFYMQDKEWNQHHIGEDFVPSNNIPVYQDGTFYFLDKRGSIATFRIEEDGSSWEVLTELKSPWLDSESNYLLECEKEILSVFVGESGRKVLVFQLDQCKKAWIRVKSLGHHMLFVSNSSCFSMKAKIAGMENKIYYPRHNKLNRMIFYSLDTSKYHTFDSDISLDYFSPDIWEQSRSSWILPSS